MSWEKNEYFDEQWKERIRQMAAYIPDDASSVMDLGCGKMWLNEMLPSSYKYYGIDYTDRGKDSYVFDLNKYAFPAFNCDIIFISGCLEYIYDTEWLITQVAGHCNKKCIISYCTIEDFPGIPLRHSLHWVNNLSEKDILSFFSKNKMILEEKTKTRTHNTIFIFSK